MCDFSEIKECKRCVYYWEAHEQCYHYWGIKFGLNYVAGVHKEPSNRCKHFEP
jgi:hypothetical protein